MNEDGDREECDEEDQMSGGWPTARHMVVTVLVRANALVTVEMLARDENVDAAMRQRVTTAVIREADKSAWKVRPESVHIRRDDEGYAHSHKVLYIGTWSPLSARFVGGEYDGETVELNRDEHSGLPPTQLHLPYRDRGVVSVNANDLPQLLVRNPVYRCIGTHPIDDVWIYEHERSATRHAEPMRRPSV